MDIPSRLISDALAELEKLPGIGRKTALRLVIDLLRKDEDNATRLGEAIVRMRRDIKFCTICHHVDDTEICHICANPARNAQVICVVENFRDVIAIENTHHYTGVYHVLGGIIAPLDGVGPDELNIPDLLDRVKQNDVQEVIMALSPTLEGDTTIYYLSKQITALKPIHITTIARGVAFGGDLEYVDDHTLARSLVNRVPYQNMMQNTL